ncbi:methyltransferase [Limimonas halophila]|uniref:Methyltransferase n=1 Tax=Limimonas halophila TaxID=1082479 RepID=A0A1G7NJQ3_9PROT|nr:isoprenylcysteine carboxylmethyltransferase family protein [Limimonas halophila]SDF74192.1 methyltransferase [Limimonas halophila]
MIGLAQAVAGLVAVQRLAELAYSRANERRLRHQGGREHGAGHYPLLVGLHAAWLAAIAVTVPPDAPVSIPLLAVFVALQGARVWIIASLGARWTTRVLVVPGEKLVSRGAYRWLRHPNYAVVAAEIAVLPAAFNAWEIAIPFGIANLAVLGWRIRVEENALQR